MPKNYRRLEEYPFATRTIKFEGILNKIKKLFVAQPLYPKLPAMPAPAQSVIPEVKEDNKKKTLPEYLPEYTSDVSGTVEELKKESDITKKNINTFGYDWRAINNYYFTTLLQIIIIYFLLRWLFGTSSR